MRSSCTCATRLGTAADGDRRTFSSDHSAKSNGGRKVMGRFPGEGSCLTLVWAVLDLFITHQTNGIRFTELDRQRLNASDTRNPTKPHSRRSPPHRLTHGNLSRGEFTAAKGRRQLQLRCCFASMRSRSCAPIHASPPVGPTCQRSPTTAAQRTPASTLRPPQRSRSWWGARPHASTPGLGRAC